MEIQAKNRNVFTMHQFMFSMLTLPHMESATYRKYGLLLPTRGTGNVFVLSVNYTYFLDNTLSEDINMNVD